jgi:hypothetical protein
MRKDEENVRLTRQISGSRDKNESFHENRKQE